MTNLEKIQSMDRSTLASFLTHSGFSCINCSESGHMDACDCECTKHCYEWLDKNAT